MAPDRGALLPISGSASEFCLLWGGYSYPRPLDLKEPPHSFPEYYTPGGVRHQRFCRGSRILARRFVRWGVLRQTPFFKPSAAPVYSCCRESPCTSSQTYRRVL